MKRKWLKLDTFGNYVRCGSKHVFFGELDQQDYNDALSNINTLSDNRIHMFICNEGALDYRIMKLIQWFIQNNRNTKAKFLIHIPKTEKYLVEKLIKRYPEVKKPPFRVLTEKDGVLFRIRKQGNYAFNIEYGKSAMISRIDFWYEDYVTYSSNDKIVQKAENIEEDRESTIARFKATSPLSILKSFKDEDDIWNFITLNEEWSINKMDIIKEKVSITTTKKDPEEIKKEVEDVIKNALKNIKNGGI